MGWVTGTLKFVPLAAALMVVPLLGPPAAGAAAPVATAAANGPLNLRSGPSTVDARVGSVANGARLAVVCQVYSQQIAGTVRNSPFWDRLSNGRYVADAFVRWSPARPFVPWCAPGGASYGTVNSGGGPVNVRAGASSSSTKVGTLANGTRLSVACQQWGERVAGNVRTTNTWNRLTNGRYVSDALVTWKAAGPVIPWCGQAPPTIPAANATEFLKRVAEPARAGFRTYKVPASVTIAQSILESGWGRSGLTRRDHSYFGIKCFGTPGTIAVGCRAYATHECDGNRCYPATAEFRVYRNATGSFADHGNFLRVNSRYKNAFRYSTNPDQFAREIHKAGYATSPTYANDLIALMKDYNLYRYDE
jgi:flagellar protein FlgJ